MCCAALAFSFDSLQTIEIRGHSKLALSWLSPFAHHPFKLPCISIVSNVNGMLNLCASVSEIVHNPAVNALNVSNRYCCTSCKYKWRLSTTRTFAMAGEHVRLYIRVIIFGISFPQFQKRQPSSPDFSWPRVAPVVANSIFVIPTPYCSIYCTVLLFPSRANFHRDIISSSHSPHSSQSLAWSAILVFVRWCRAHQLV